MARASFLTALILAVAAVAVSPAAAHHTFVVKYDASKIVTVSGTIVSVGYENPHIHFEVQGAGATWSVETESIPVARASGLTPAVLKEGAKVTVTGWPARDGSRKMGLRSISIAGGPSATLRRSAR